MWSSSDVIGLFSNNVVSFSRNVVLRVLLFSLNSVLKPRMLSVRADYVLNSLHLGGLATALVDTFILLIVISKVPAAVASICGVSAGGTGGYGMSTLFAGVGMGAQAAAMVSGVGAGAMAGGRALGSAVRNAVKQGQALSRGNP